MDPDLEYLRECIERAEIVPHPWDGEDRNIGAFRSKEELIAWFCQPPGEDGQPYRDRAFYMRELAMLSRLVRPEVVVEFGTCQGIGTCLLRWLNPDARLITIDNREETFIPGDVRVRVGHLARWNHIECTYLLGNSNTCHCLNFGVGLCFIDADHSYSTVLADSERAWENKCAVGKWAIAWHDHNDRHPGVVKAVRNFCRWSQVDLQSRPDSDTVWIMGGAQ